MEFKLTSVSYTISVFKDDKASKLQKNGFLLDMGLPVKICIRHESDTWYADDFETGFAIREFGFPSLDLQEFLEKLYDLIDEKIKSGKYEQAIAKAKNTLVEIGMPA